LFVRRSFVLSVIVMHGLLSLSRTLAIVDGYSAPVRLLTHENSSRAFARQLNNDGHVCIGKDWYRFPSHFFLPDKY
jgi:alpha-1,2-mannosyltransferase